MSSQPSSADVRARIMDALRVDLVGPRPGFADHAMYFEEVLPMAPSKWYLLGFLVPFGAPIEERSDDDGDEALDEVGKPALDDDETPETGGARKGAFPSSIGLSVLVPAGARSLDVVVRWGDYAPVEGPGESEGAAPTRRWKRTPREARTSVGLGGPSTVGLPGFADLKLVVSVRAVRGARMVPEGTRSVSVFLVNWRPPAPDVKRDAAYVFQPDLRLELAAGFVPRPDLHGQSSDDPDELVADLQYRDVVELAVGHNVAAVAERDGDGVCRAVESAWMPTADVDKVVPRAVDGVELRMETLAAAPSAEAIRGMVGPMVAGYEAWIDGQAATALSDERKVTADKLLARARGVAGRIRGGLAALDDPKVLEAFRIANRTIARAIRQRACHDREDLKPEAVKAPTWRPFQLAFLLTNLAGAAHSDHPDRGVVDLLFFPTGGGKTEAYLGLAAFVMALRRLRDPTVGSAGVSVLMRYTLRLLTLDQLGRAATLVCALELERQADVGKLGPWPFEIGLWVGQGATPNRMGRKGDKDEHSARARTIAFLNDTKHKDSPIPLETCPWCGWQLTKDCFKLLPDNDEPRDLRVMCRNRGCEFHARRQARGIPILSVDEPIYRRLPAFLIATVDKLANMPWVGAIAGLFGRVERHDDDGFYGPAEPNVGRPLAGRLPPPDLVIQDELHLISGPLGTMVGLYETAIDALSGARTKIVASTATVRRAERQIRALFGRGAVEVFPPPGPDRKDSYFAITVGPEVRNPRTYVGVAAQGRNLKVVMLRVYLALMGAAQRAWQEGGGERAGNPADPYMTLLGYFNTLRELGGARRIVEDEVTTRLIDLGTRRRRVGEKVGRFDNRKRVTEPRELTSRVGTSEVAETKRRLALGFADKQRVDVALATNMISVGLDITRLGLMVVLGQPKTAAEYIQATSRVGRDDERPGLVVTLLNLFRPRDRSHYERFGAWHESFYRAVEATSVTPFSPRAIDRGMAAVTVALARLGHAGMTAPRGAFAVSQHRQALAFVPEVISRRAEGHDLQLGKDAAEELRKKVKERVTGLLDAWAAIATRKGDLQYQKEVGVAPPLLFQPLDPELARLPADARQFKANRSLRDVEPSVNLWLVSPDGTVIDTEDDA